MKLSVIIPAYNALDSVLRALNSLRALADHEHEYIVQDDYMDAPVGLEAYIPPCVASTQRNPENFGFGGNCNAGAARASGDILFFVNQDVYGVPGLSEHWDRELLSVFDNPLVGMAGCKLVFPDGCIQHAGVHFDAKCQPTHRYLGYSDHRYSPANQPQEIPAVTGAALAIRAELFGNLGGFDTAWYHKAYFEDVDLCARVVRSGYAIWYQPTVQLVHEVGSTGGSPYFAHNALQFKKRWVDTGYVQPDIDVIRERFW